MNKYQAAAKKARKVAKARRRADACRAKEPFETREAAAQAGMMVYRCEVCSQWHRASTPGHRLRKVYPEESTRAKAPNGGRSK